MKRIWITRFFLVVLAVAAGCAGTAPTPAPQQLYVCPNGETVTSPDLCPRPTTPQPTTTQTQAPTTTPTPATTPTTSPPTTLATTTSTSSSTTTTLDEHRPVLEIIDETISEGPSGEFWLEGQIRNNGGTDQFLVQVRLTLFDKYGKAFPTLNSAPIEKIGAGETAEFNTIKTTILKSNVATYNLSVRTGV